MIRYAIAIEENNVIMAIEDTPEETIREANTIDPLYQYTLEDVIETTEEMGTWSRYHGGCPSRWGVITENGSRYLHIFTEQVNQ